MTESEGTEEGAIGTLGLAGPRGSQLTTHTAPRQTYKMQNPTRQGEFPSTVQITKQVVPWLKLQSQERGTKITLLCG